MIYESFEKHLKNSGLPIRGYSSDFFEEQKASSEQIKKFTVSWVTTPGSFEQEYFQSRLQFTHFSRAKKDCTLVGYYKIKANEVFFAYRYIVYSNYGYLPTFSYMKNLFFVLTNGRTDIVGFSPPHEFVLVGNKKITAAEFKSQFSNSSPSDVPVFCSVSN